VSRILAYCAFRQSPELTLPMLGVNATPVQVLSSGELSLLWSEVAWPFDPERMQKSAVEFHEVVHQVFRQTAVIPFRLLSVFDDLPALKAFIEENQVRFLEDLERLRAVVQMECVIYPAPNRVPPSAGSGRAYLEQKVAALRSTDSYIQEVRDALSLLSRDVRVREAKKGTRIFVLVDRGRETDFRQAVSAIATPEHLSRRLSGPWPAAEFLSELVKMPQTAGEK
jgi:hypothetical protein